MSQKFVSASHGRVVVLGFGCGIWSLLLGMKEIADLCETLVLTGTVGIKFLRPLMGFSDFG